MDKLIWYDSDGRINCRRGYEVALARLASYEATDMMPDEIVKMGMAYEDSKRYSGRLELKLNATAKQIPRWIPVTERLPEDDATVLTYKNGIVEVQKYEKRRNGWICKGWFWSLANVTHWMPLPEPPKEASRND